MSAPAALKARAISRDGGAQPVRALARSSGHDLYPALDPVDSLGNEAKVVVLKRLDRYLRAADESETARRALSATGGFG